MNELAKEIQKKYINEITNKYPLYRFFIIFIILITIYLYSKQENLRLLKEISTIKVNFIFDFKNGILSLISVKDIILALILSKIINFFYCLYVKLLFNILFKLSKTLSEYMKKLENEIKKENNYDIVIKSILIKETSEKYKKIKIKLISYHNSSEIVISIIFCLLYGFKNFIILDWRITFILIGYVFYNNWKAFKYYISDFLPYYITINILKGKETVFGKQD